MRREELTAEVLRQEVTYDPETGAFAYAKVGYNNTSKPGQRFGIDDGAGYLRGRLFGKRYRLHRLAWLYVHGAWPQHEIDHINGNRSDNRIANLRDVPRQMNVHNARRRTPGATGLRGVTVKHGGFVAQITTNYEGRYLGRFQTAEEAHEAYTDARKRLHLGYVE